jgi:hypothetical protein
MAVGISPQVLFMLMLMLKCCERKTLSAEVMLKNGVHILALDGY